MQTDRGGESGMSAILEQAHGTITLELRGRVMFATYSGVLGTDAFDRIEPRLQALFDRLYSHYWAMVADVSGWEEPQTETIARNAALLATCQDNGMRMLANVVSPVTSTRTNPNTELRPDAGHAQGDFQARDFRYLDEAEAWLASVGY
jgi:hypothetical protein